MNADDTSSNDNLRYYLFLIEGSLNTDLNQAEERDHLLVVIDYPALKFIIKINFLVISRMGSSPAAVANRARMFLAPLRH